MTGKGLDSGAVLSAIEIRERTSGYVCAQMLAAALGSRLER